VKERKRDSVRLYVCAWLLAAAPHLSRCVCVCEREREINRERKSDSVCVYVCAWLLAAALHLIWSSWCVCVFELVSV
jgi:hypothetical protein